MKDQPHDIHAYWDECLLGWMPTLIRLRQLWPCSWCPCGTCAKGRRFKAFKLTATFFILHIALWVVNIFCFCKFFAAPSVACQADRNGAQWSTVPVSLPVQWSICLLQLPVFHSIFHLLYLFNFPVLFPVSRFRSQI